MLIFWLCSLLGFVALGTLWRVLFFAFYSPGEISGGTIAHAFFLGARFDLSIACYGLSVPLLVWLIARIIALVAPEKITALQPQGRLALWAWCGLWAAIVSFVSMIDIGFYGFFQDRLNTLLFGFIEDDTTALISTIWKNYPAVWILIGLLLLFIAQFKFFQFLAARMERPRRLQLSPGLLAAGAFSLFMVNSLGARGSVSLFPLSEMDTHIASHPFVNLLAFNPGHAFARAVANKAQSRAKWNSNLEGFGYGEDARKAWADCYGLAPEDVPEDPRSLLRRTTPANAWARENKPHVIVLVMESMGAHWLSYREEPFDLVGPLKEHLTPAKSLTTFLSSTTATIGSLSSLMAGVPHRPFSDFLTEGEYLATKVRTAPAETYRRQGYRTRFLYAGNPGWRDIGKYALIQGFDTVEGDTEMAAFLERPLARHDWGLFDEDLWDYVERTLSEATEPQFLLVMTTANHPPYLLPPGQPARSLAIPDEIKARKVGDLGVIEQRFQSFRHSNEKLAEFLNRLDHTVWGRRSVVAVTGDHSFWVVSFTEKELLQKSSVPLILKLPPGVNASFPPRTFGAHDQIWPMLYNLTLDQVEFDTMSDDLLDPNGNPLAINFSRVILGREGGVVVGNQASTDAALSWQPGDLLESTPATPAFEAMALKYRCTMSALDDFFRRERKDSSP